MTLEAAKGMLTYISHAYDYGDVYSRDDLEAIETVLKALEDSVPKEKVIERIAEITENYNLVINEAWDSADVICAKREEMAQIDILKELLGE